MKPGFAVLKHRVQIDEAEAVLRKRGIAPPQQAGLGTRLRRLARQAGAAANLVPDPIKSWDVLQTIQTIEAEVGKDEPVLDMGAVGCAILPSLHRLGYRRLHGIDLNPQVRHMEFNGAVDYSVQDMTATRFESGSMAAITSISVIEHGVHGDDLFREVARLLRPGGLFLFSTDYWPHKIDTSEAVLFGLPWRIHSAEEIKALVASAEPYGLAPAGELGGVLDDAEERPVHFEGRDYTFLFGALVRKSARL
jgi:SAM-dependent methyltransferase